MQNIQVIRGLCGPNSISLSPTDFPELLLTECDGKLHFRRQLDFCESKLSQCWHMDVVEIDEDEAETKFLVTPKEGRIMADTEAELQLAVEVMMDEFLQYFSAAGLSMNPTKSELIVFRRGRQESVLKVGDQEESGRIKLLGVNVDKGYSFDRIPQT